MLRISDTTEVRVLSIFDPVLEANPDKVFDYTKLTAISTCPTYGLIRYHAHKVMDGGVGGRSMALEAGKACHDFFAALRFYMFRYLNPQWDGESHETLWMKQMMETFNGDAYAAMMNAEQKSDPITNALAFALPALHHSGFYDDPLDKRRTMANLEEACIAYAERVLRKPSIPAVLETVDGPRIGIEIPFALEIKHRNHDVWYYIGRIDGVVEDSGVLLPEENKTTGRIDSAWRMSFHTTHQITGYTLAIQAIIAAAFVDGNRATFSIDDLDIPMPARLLGVQIPQPKKFGESTAVEDMHRTGHHIISFLDWAQRQIALAQRAVPGDTYQNTHACNRYFRACEFIPLCVMSSAERVEAVKELPANRWNPLENIKEGHKDGTSNED